MHKANLDHHLEARPTMSGLAERVASRYLEAKMLKVGPARVDQSATRGMQQATLKARSRGDFQGALLSAGYHAQKQNRSMFVYSGNSFGHRIWRVSYKESEYLDAINNTGTKIIEVTPDLTVSVYDVQRGKTAATQPLRTRRDYGADSDSDEEDDL